MKKLSIIIVSIAALIITGCNNTTNKETAQQENSTVVKLSREEIQSRSFSDLFKAIDIKDVEEDVFTLVNKDFTVLTAGNPQHYNSMVASWGGWGILFDKPVTWCFLRSNRYTLELMRNEQTYTMIYFDDEYKNDIMLFGTKSGKETDKMKESKLTPVQTPRSLEVVSKENADVQTMVLPCLFYPYRLCLIKHKNKLVGLSFLLTFLFANINIIYKAQPLLINGLRQGALAFIFAK